MREWNEYNWINSYCDYLENILYGNQNGFDKIYAVSLDTALILHKHKRSYEKITDNKKVKR